jgi:glutamyl/glutaminyl-tRNA synthetase
MEILRALVESGAAYPCFCADDASFEHGDHKCGDMDRSERDSRVSQGETYCCRFKVAGGPNYIYHDRLRGNISVPTAAIEDFVLARSDGSATYLLAAAVDDHDFGVTHVIRGEEHMSNVPKQEMIYKSLGWNVPEWVHIPMILDAERRKLSKRLGAMSLGEYRELGWAPEAIVAYLATLSWAKAPVDRIASLEELAMLFDLDSVAHFSPVHDEARMRHFGRVFVAAASDENLTRFCEEAFSSCASPKTSDDEKLALIHELLPECATFGELGSAIMKNLSFAGDLHTETPEWFGDFVAHLALISDADWSSSNIKNALKTFQNNLRLKGSDFYHPIRIFLTGMSQGAPLGLILSCVGRDASIKRLGVPVTKRTTDMGGENFG